MPTIKEMRRSGLHLPELHLPHMDKDEIAKSLSDVRLSDMKVKDIDLSKIERPRVEMPEMPDIDLPSSADVRRAVEDVAIRVGLRPRRQSPLRFLAGLAIIAGLTAFVVTRPMVRSQLERSAQKARERIDEMRREREARNLTIDPSDIAVPVSPGAWSDPDVTATFDVTQDSGAQADPYRSNGDDIPAFEESESTSRV
jgi:hypothetical protein